MTIHSEVKGPAIHLIMQYDFIAGIVIGNIQKIGNSVAGIVKIFVRRYFIDEAAGRIENIYGSRYIEVDGDDPAPGQQQFVDTRNP